MPSPRRSRCPIEFVNRDFLGLAAILEEDLDRVADIALVDVKIIGRELGDFP